MHKIITYILIGFLIVSCGYFGDKVDFFKGIDLNDKADWLLVKSNPDYKTCGVIYDKDLLLKLHKEFVIKSTSECGGTTPDNNIALYKNGKWIKSVGYCSWEPLSYNLGGLKRHFKDAELKTIKAKSIDRHDIVLDSLTQLDNIYLLYPKDTIIDYPNQLKFDIKLINTNQDIFKQEKPIEKEFKRIFGDRGYRVKADWYSSEIGNPRKLGYHIIVDCDSSFLEYFDKSRLIESELFQEMTDYKFITKKFTIRYYEWSE